MDALICDFIAIDALQLLEIDRYFLPVGGALSIEDERGPGSGGHLSVN